ncbi:hypothetical protein KCU78_g2389, partial [Aureobasidium melanogenum]
MPSRPMLSALLAVCLPMAIAAPTNSADSCADIASAIPAGVDPTPFCRSYISIATRPTYIYVNDPTFTSTIITTASTVFETVATSTLTFCDARPTNVKREQTSLSPEQKTSEACSCLSIPPETVTHTATDIYHTTITPTVTSSVTAYETHVGASKVEIKPSYLVSPTPVSWFQPEYLDHPLDFSEPIHHEWPIRFRNISTLDRNFENKTYILSASVNGGLSIVAPGGGYLTPSPSPNLPSAPYDSGNIFAVLWGAHSVNAAIRNPTSNQTQGIRYATQGTAPRRTLTIEWILGSSVDVSSQHFRFWVTFFEDQPQRFRYTYWDVSDGGKDGWVVGAENEQTSAVQFSGSDQLNNIPGHEITSGLVLEYEYATNSFIASTIWEGLC